MYGACENQIYGETNEKRANFNISALKIIFSISAISFTTMGCVILSRKLFSIDPENIYFKNIENLLGLVGVCSLFSMLAIGHQ